MGLRSELKDALGKAAGSGQLDLRNRDAVVAFVKDYAGSYRENRAAVAQESATSQDLVSRGISPTIYRSEEDLAAARKPFEMQDRAATLNRMAGTQQPQVQVTVPRIDAPTGAPPWSIDQFNLQQPTGRYVTPGDEAPAAAMAQSIPSARELRPPTDQEAAETGRVPAMEVHAEEARKMYEWAKANPKKASAALATFDAGGNMSFGSSDLAQRLVAGRTPGQMAQLKAAMAQGVEEGGGVMAKTVIPGAIGIAGLAPTLVGGGGVGRALAGGAPGWTARTLGYGVTEMARDVATPELREAAGGPESTEDPMFRAARGLTAGASMTAGTGLSKILPGVRRVPTIIAGDAAASGGQAAAFAPEGERWKAAITGTGFGAIGSALGARGEAAVLDGQRQLPAPQARKMLTGPVEQPFVRAPLDPAVMPERLPQAAEQMPQATKSGLTPSEEAQVRLVDERGRLPITPETQGLEPTEFGSGGLNLIPKPLRAVADKVVGATFNPRHVFRQFWKGMTDPTGAVRESFAHLDRAEANIANDASVPIGVRSFFSKAPRGIVKELKDEFNTLEMADRLNVADARMKLAKLSGPEEKAFWYRVEKRQPQPTAELEQIVASYDDLTNRTGDEYVAHGILSPETIAEFRQPGTRYVRRDLSPKRLAEMRRKKVGVTQSTGTPPSGPERSGSFVPGGRPEIDAPRMSKFLESVAQRRKYRTPEEADAAGFVTGKEPILVGWDEMSTTNAALRVMRKVHDDPKYKHLWREAETDGRGNPVAPEPGSGWYLAEDSAWGILKNKLVHEDLYDGFRETMDLRGSGLGEELQTYHNVAGTSVVMGSMPSIMRSFAIEGPIALNRSGHGFGQIMSTIPKAWKAMADHRRGVRNPNDWIIKELSAGREWDVGSYIERNIADESMSPTAQATDYKDIGGAGKQYREAFKQRGEEITAGLLESARRKSMTATGAVKQSDYRPRVRAAKFRAFVKRMWGIDPVRWAGVDLDKLAERFGFDDTKLHISGEAFTSLARFMDHTWKWIGHYLNRTQGPGSNLVPRVGQALGITKRGPLTAAESIRVQKQLFDPQETTPGINTLSKAWFRFLRPRYKVFQNALSQGMAYRNPVSYAMSIYGAASVTAGTVAMFGLSDKEADEIRLIAANGNPAKAKSIAILPFKWPDGSFLTMDTTFWNVWETAKSLVPGAGVQKSDPDEPLVNRVARGIASENVLASKAAEVAGYNLNFGSKVKDQTLLKTAAGVGDLVLPTASINRTAQSLSKSADQRAAGDVPTNDEMATIVNQFTGLGISRVYPKGSKERRQQMNRAQYIEKLNTFGGKTYTTPATEGKPKVRVKRNQMPRMPR